MCIRDRNRPVGRKCSRRIRRYFLKKFLSAAEQAAESEDLMEFFNSAVDTLQTIVVGLGGALCVWGGINLLEGYGPVSYTHLDVYKRQGQWFSG